MRKFAANYLVSDGGIYLKNGIVVVGDTGAPVQYIHTNNDLREIAQLSFLNGILMAEYTFKKVTEANLGYGHPLESLIINSLSRSSQFSMHEMIKLGKQIQLQFPEMKIPEILNGITEVLHTTCGYAKENIPGIVLLMGIDLVNLHFTAKSRLKKIC